MRIILHDNDSLLMTTNIRSLVVRYPKKNPTGTTKPFHIRPDFLLFPSNGGINDDTSQSVQRRMSICKTEIHQWTVEAVEGGVRSDFRPFPSNGGNIDQLPFRSSQKWIQWTLTFTSSLSCIVAQASVKRWAASKGRKHM